MTIPANGTVTASLRDTVSFPPPGSLVVHKTITGTAAGQQGTVRIRVICDETPDDSLPVFEIPAGTSGTVSKTYDGIPAGARCTVTELVNGSTSTVQVQVDGSGQTVHRPGRIDADRRPHRHLHVRARLAHRPEVDRRQRRRPPGGGADRGRLRQGLADSLTTS